MDLHVLSLVSLMQEKLKTRTRVEGLDASTLGQHASLHLRQILFVAAAAILLLSELLSGPVSDGIGRYSLIWAVGSCLLLAASAWSPAIGGSLYSGLTVIGICLPREVLSLALPMVGIYVLGVDWIARGWALPATAILLSSELAQLSQSSTPRADIVGAALGVTFTLVIGAVLRWGRRQRAALEEHAHRVASEAELSVRHSLAAALHDDVASELVRVILTSSGIARGATDPELASEIEELGDRARIALGRLRALMAESGEGGPPTASEPFGQIIHTCRAMLSGRDIDLVSEVVGDVDSSCTARQRAILAGAVREGATNTLKFARPGSTARLVVELLPDGAVDLMLASEMPPPPAIDHGVLSGGLGLENLSIRVAGEGGRVLFGPNHGSWVLTLSLPGEPPPATRRSSAPRTGEAGVPGATLESSPVVETAKREGERE